jgi:hypothetical protein
MIAPASFGYTTSNPQIKCLGNSNNLNIWWKIKAREILTIF